MTRTSKLVNASAMIPFPNISPEIFSVTVFGFEFALRWYAVSYIAGFVAAYYLMRAFVRKVYLWRLDYPPIEDEQVEDFLTHLILGVIIGGRLGYVFFYNFSYYLTSPLDILKIWDGGMSFHGGFLGVVIAAMIFSSKNAVNFIGLADLLAVASPPGLLFGRIANFINAELWGRPTDVPWGVVFPGEAAQTCPGVVGVCARHPSQLYEAGLEGILLFILLLLLVLRGAFKRPGLLAGVFVAGYGASRFYVEYFRVPDAQFFSSENPYGYAYTFGDFGLTMGQTLSLPMVLVGCVFIISALTNSKH